MYAQISPVDQFRVTIWIYLSVSVLILSLAFLIYRRSKKFDLWDAGTKNLTAMMIALSILPLNDVVNCLDTIIGSGELLSPNRPPLVRFIGANFTIIGLTAFIVFYVFYVKEVINLSDFVRKLYNFSVIVLVAIGLMSLAVNLNDLISQVSSRNSIYFIVLTSVALLILIIS
ncbi:MAG: hypothetical protein ACFFBD_23965, partial [Candidatus Hodarchaeota archaeon]